MLLVRLLFSLLLATVAGCTPFGLPNGPIRDADPTRPLVTGVAWRDESGHVPIRHEVSELKISFPDQWSLYVLALRTFHDSDQASPLSSYQISGIHGRPYKVWGDAQGLEGKQGGYCPHQNTLFASWHRPYVALFEQELYKYVQNIAYSAPPESRERWASAADSFRVPFWDFAIGETNSVPDFFLTPIIDVVGPDGINKTIANPLYQKDFHSLIPGDFVGKWASQNHTLRWPDSDGPTAQSHNEAFVKSFNAQRRTFKDTIGKGFAVAETLNSFSLLYLEEVHGWVHYTIGGDKPDNPFTGHMWPVEYSAYEPIFMLIHANVDRLFALWQAVQPDNWFTPASVGPRSNFVIAENQIVDGNTPLAPFWIDATRFWTANDCRETTALGYAYPETQSWLYATNAEYRHTVNATIARLYSMSSRDMLTGETSVIPGDMLGDDRSFTEWSLDLHALHSQLPSTFQARFYFSWDFSSDAAKEVGAWNVLMPSTHREHAMGKKRDDVDEEPLLEGQVSLTSNLLDCIANGKLASLEESDVLPFLRDRLTWKVFGDGKQVPSTQLQGLTVEVNSRKAFIPEDENRTIVFSSDIVWHPEVTAGKGGGVKM